jgi:hypothetical protein
MLEHHVFGRGDTAPSWWANAIQRALSVSAEQFTVRLASSTTIEVPAAADDGAAVIAIEGRWRWNEATETRAHPGGGAGTYRVWVTAADNDIVNVPDVGTDLTDYSFALAITAAAAEPVIVPGTVDIFREVASLEWDGVAITSVTPLVGSDAAVASLLASQPQVVLRRTGATAAVHGANNAIPFDAVNSVEEVDTHGMHNPAGVNNSRITPTVAGLYVVTGQVGGGPSASNTREAAWISKNGPGTRYGSTEHYRPGAGIGAAGGQLCVAALIPLDVGDYIELYYYLVNDAAGGPMSIATAEFSAARISATP